MVADTSGYKSCEVVAATAAALEAAAAPRLRVQQAKQELSAGGALVAAVQQGATSTQRKREQEDLTTSTQRKRKQEDLTALKDAVAELTASALAAVKAAGAGSARPVAALAPLLRAKEIFDASVELQRAEPLDHIATLSNLACVHDQLQNNDSALRTFQESLEAALVLLSTPSPCQPLAQPRVKEALREMCLAIYVNVSRSFDRQGRLEEALLHLQHALSLRHECGLAENKDAVDLMLECAGVLDRMNESHELVAGRADPDLAAKARHLRQRAALITSRLAPMLSPSAAHQPPLSCPGSAARVATAEARYARA